MEKVYVIVQETSERGGHGEPRMSHLSLATSGNSYVSGETLPVFRTELAAELAIEKLDKWGCIYKVIPLSVDWRGERG